MTRALQDTAESFFLSDTITNRLKVSRAIGWKVTELHMCRVWSIAHEKVVHLQETFQTWQFWMY